MRLVSTLFLLCFYFYLFAKKGLSVTTPILKIVRDEPTLALLELLELLRPSLYVAAPRIADGDKVDHLVDTRHTLQKCQRPIIALLTEVRE